MLFAFLFQILGYFSALIGFLYAFRIIYILAGAVGTRHYPAAERVHRLGIVIAACNEERVIGRILKSLKSQDYPAEMTDVWVIADNCTDRTAAIARAHGAHVLERRDPEHRTKGYALEYFFDSLQKQKIQHEAYLILDADNVLAPDYLSRMNEAYDAGEKIVTSYRATLNMERGLMPFAYALHWLRTVRLEHRGRSLLGMATRIQGTGFLMDAELVRDGWHYTSLTEDRAFCADAVARGYRIGYCDAAVFYDEQPVQAAAALRQRIRWSRGHLEAFRELSPRLLSRLVHARSFKDAALAYDMLSVVFPAELAGAFVSMAKGFLALYLVVGYPPHAPQPSGIMTALLVSLLMRYLGSVLQAVYVLLSEHRRMPKLSFSKTVLAVLTFRLFDTTERISGLVALLRPVEWVPTPHGA